MLVIAYLWSWQTWRQQAELWPTPWGVRDSHKHKQSWHRAAMCVNGNGNDPTDVPSHMSEPGLCCTVCSNTSNRSWPDSNAQYLYNEKLFSTWISSADLVDSCWKNRLESSIMDQNEKPLDRMRESFQDICVFPHHRLKQERCFVNAKHPWNKEIRRKLKKWKLESREKAGISRMPFTIAVLVSKRYSGEQCFCFKLYCCFSFFF